MTADDPIRRVIHPEKPCNVGALVPKRPGGHWAFLVRHAGEAAYQRVSPFHEVQPGDEVVAWLWHPGRLDEIQAENVVYTEGWYGSPPVVGLPPWPDELEVIDTWVPESGARVLETCCGTGRTLPALLRGGNQVVGLDISRWLLALARGHRPPGLRYVCGDACELPFPDASFDAVLCFENSLGEFLSDPLTPLLEMIRVCRPGGCAIVALRDIEDPQMYWAASGHFHVVRTFPPERRDALVETALAHAPRVESATVEAGGPRPWGGVIHHVVFKVGGTGARR